MVGASADRNKYGNKVLRAYLQAGRRVFPVNPKLDEVEGQRCYPDLASLPEPVFGVSIVTPPAVTENVVEQAAAAGIRHLWMQPGAQSEAAIARAQSLGLELIHSGPCVLVAQGFSEGAGRRIGRGRRRLDGLTAHPPQSGYYPGWAAIALFRTAFGGIRMQTGILGTALAAVLATFSFGQAQAQPGGGIPVPPLPDEPFEYQTAVEAIRVVPLARGLENPWSLAFLPDESILITERNGRLRHFKDGELSGPVPGLPEVVADNFISGLHDIKLHPDFEQNRLSITTVPAAAVPAAAER